MIQGDSIRMIIRVNMIVEIRKVIIVIIVTKIIRNFTLSLRI
jgi:hypothetical protein